MNSLQRNTDGGIQIQKPVEHKEYNIWKEREFLLSKAKNPQLKYIQISIQNSNILKTLPFIAQLSPHFCQKVDKNQST